MLSYVDPKIPRELLRKLAAGIYTVSAQIAAQLAAARAVQLRFLPLRDVQNLLLLLLLAILLNLHFGPDDRLKRDIPEKKKTKLGFQTNKINPKKTESQQRKKCTCWRPNCLRSIWRNGPRMTAQRPSENGATKLAISGGQAS
jgi:hypothetical protein